MPGIKTIEQNQYQRKIYSVSELNGRCKQVLEGEFSTVWLEAEISNLAKPASGHWYFSLKDQKAQVRCAMFKFKNRSCVSPPEEGMKVLVRAKVSLFEPRGEFQLIVEYLEAAGVGALLREYEQLKAKLDQEGLFDSSAKKPISHFNQRIGVVTSATGAAIHDVISVIRRRFPLQQLVIYPCLVQGNLAAQQIIHQINVANQRQEVDLLLLVRGGGSLEDLWCFNDEVLARTIFASALPIVTGIGHEVDFTIADFVADLRAPTPSAAAEKSTPDQRELLEQIAGLQYWLTQFMENKFQGYSQKIDWLLRQLQSPESVIEHRQQSLALLQHRLGSALKDRHSSMNQRLQNLQLRLSKLDPSVKIETAKQQRIQLKQRLMASMDKHFSENQSKFRELSIKLDSLSPLAILGRGYSVTSLACGELVTDAKTVEIGSTITSRLKDGRIDSQVTKIH